MEGQDIENQNFLLAFSKQAHVRNNIDKFLNINKIPKIKMVIHIYKFISINMMINISKILNINMIINISKILNINIIININKFQILKNVRYIIKIKMVDTYKILHTNKIVHMTLRTLLILSTFVLQISRPCSNILPFTINNHVVINYIPENRFSRTFFFTRLTSVLKSL